MRCRAMSLLMLVAFLANSFTVQATAPAGIPWAGTVRDGLKQALINQKQILLYFHAPELPACASCEAQVLGNPEVQQAIAASYIPVKVNVREVPATARFYQANDDAQLPRVMILSADDKVVARFTASSNPTEFVAQLKAGVNVQPANPKLEQISSLAKTATSFLAPTAEPTATTNATLAANTPPNNSSAVTPTAWQANPPAAGANALLLPNFAPNNAAPTSPNTTNLAEGTSSLLPAAVGPLVRNANDTVTFSAPNASGVTAAPAIPNLANYGVQGVIAPTSPAAAPAGYGMQNIVPNLAAAAQPYQQQAQQTATQWQNTANQTLTNAQTEANQSLANAQQNLQNQYAAVSSTIANAAPAAGSFYDAGLSPRPSATQGANLANVPGMYGAPKTTVSTQPQQPSSPYSMNGVTAPAVSPYSPVAAQPSYSPAAAPTATAPTAAPAPTNYALAPGASYGIPNNAPPAPALPGHPKEKAGLANYSTDNLQGYLGSGGKPVPPSSQVSQAVAAKQSYSTPPTSGIASAAPAQAPAPAAMEIGLQGNCPVTIAESIEWAKGDPQYGAMHRGKTYLFASAAQQQKFLAAPDKYCPVLGGNDPVVMLHEGRYLAGSPALGALYKKRMYLFCTPAAKAEFEANPSKYETAVSVAETQAGVIVR